MHILRLVAGITGGRQACISNIFLAMTIMTASLRMGSGKSKFGLSAMIERGLLPAVGCMAAIARRRQSPLMDIICPVAINASY